MVQRVLRTLLVSAGIAFVLWLIRDRLVTVWAPSSASPAPFRVPPPEDTPIPPELTAIPGIGPVYAERLVLAGIPDPAALVAAGAERVGEAAGVSPDRAGGWIEAVT